MSGVLGAQRRSAHYGQRLKPGLEAFAPRVCVQVNLRLNFPNYDFSSFRRGRWHEIGTAIDWPRRGRASLHRNRRWYVRSICPFAGCRGTYPPFGTFPPYCSAINRQIVEFVGRKQVPQIGLAVPQFQERKRWVGLLGRCLSFSQHWWPSR